MAKKERNSFDQTFDEWQKCVDRIVIEKYQVSVHDLPDVDFYTSWDADESPASFVKEVVAPMISEEFGFNLDD